MDANKKLEGDLKLIEDQSKRYINNSDLYIVKIELDKKDYASDFEIKSLAEELLCSRPQPLSVYVNDELLLLVFSCDDENPHQYDGNHHLIVCKYTSIVLKYNKNLNINVSLVELNSKLKLITYIKWTIAKYTENVIRRLSNNKIDDRLIYFRTQRELIKILEEEHDVKWKDVEDDIKFGSMVRLVKKKNKIVSEYMSEDFDSRYNQKYIKYIFR